MKKFIAFVVLCAIVGSVPGRADKPPQGAVKIPYIQQIPVQVAHHRPKKAISRFFATTTIQNQKVALHLYDLEPVGKVSQYFHRRQSRLAVFALSKQKRMWRYQFLQSVNMNREGWPEQKLIIGAFSVWIDPKKKTIPAVLLRVMNAGTSGGFTRFDNFITFMDGIKKKPAVNTFSAFEPGEGLSCCHVHYEIDKKGYIAPIGKCNDRGYYTDDFYQWNSHQFVPVERREGGTDSEEVISRWDGKQWVKQDPADNSSAKTP